MNLIQVFKQFPTQASCIYHLEKIRWNNEPVCPYCESTNTNSLQNQLRHHCNGCRKTFSVTVNTIFHDTRLPMQKWFLAIALILNAKKGLSAKQLQRDIEVTYKVAWSMGHRIRKAMADEDGLLSGIVEMDEAYVASTKSHDDDDDNTPTKRGRGTKKTPVVGMVERGGKVKVQAVGKGDLKFAGLSEIVKNSVDLDNTTLITDAYRGYSPMKTLLPHKTVNHSISYVNGDAHTNTIEGFWSVLRRAVVGQYHNVSTDYLPRYLDEIVFKYNNRKENPALVFEKLLGKMLVV